MIKIIELEDYIAKFDSIDFTGVAILKMDYRMNRKSDRHIFTCFGNTRHISTTFIQKLKWNKSRRLIEIASQICPKNRVWVGKNIYK